MSYPQIAQRVFHTPLLAAPSKAAGFVLGLGPRLLGTGKVELAGGEIEAETHPANKPFASLLDDRVGDEIRAGHRDAYRIVNGVAVIPITGTLIHRGAWVGSFSGQTSYEGIAAQIKAAAEDDVARAIALEIDSHGGEVAGCFDLAAVIRKAREEKPIHAFVCDNAHSAAYAIASQATRIVVPQAGSVGSIGVICLHADYSQRIADMGVRITVISAGDRKGDGNPYEPLPDAVRESMEAEMQTLRGIFADAVAQGRGTALSAEAALATEAACLLGEAAVDAGLADEVANPKEAFEAFANEFTWRRSASSYQATTKGPDIMATPEDNTAEPVAKPAKTDTPPATTDTPAQADSAPQPTAPVADAGSGQSTERQRIAGILDSDEAKGREALAKSFAFDSDMSVDDAKKHLAAASKAAATKTLSEDMGSAEADLDMPPASASAENPVMAAHKKAQAS